SPRAPPGRPPSSQGERRSMGTGPKGRSEVEDSRRICGSCGAASETEEDPHSPRAGAAKPVPDSSDSGSATEPEDAFDGPPLEWVQYYWTESEADATSPTARWTRQEAIFLGGWSRRSPAAGSGCDRPRAAGRTPGWRGGGSRTWPTAMTSGGCW